MKSARKGRFIVLVGIDGSGKSSLLASVDVPGLTRTSWRDLRGCEMSSALVPEAPTAIKSRLTGLARAMFIGGHFVAQYEQLVRPELERGRDVLLDSYWYKVLAKERILGELHPALTELCLLLPVPDAVILVEVEPSTAFIRKRGRPTSYEYLHTCDLNGFVRFQERLREELDKELADHPAVHRVDGGRDIASVRRSAVELIEQHAASHQEVAEALS